MRPVVNVVVSLCDFSGTWARPYTEQGCEVILVDPKHGTVDQAGRGLTEGQAITGQATRREDGMVTVGMTAGAFAAVLKVRGSAFIAELVGAEQVQVVGVLAAPPCTDFSVSGARWWAGKDADGSTAASVAIVYDCLAVVDLLKPTFWALENPIGRIAKLVPELGKYRLTFDPADFAGFADDPDKEAYTKRTALWGEFSPDLPKSHLEPVVFTKVNKAGKVLRGSWMWANLGGKSERTKELRSMTPVGFSRAFACANAAQPAPCALSVAA